MAIMKLKEKKKGPNLNAFKFLFLKHPTLACCQEKREGDCALGLQIGALVWVGVDGWMDGWI